MLKKAINSNTICIIGSFPNYAHGICDDIEAISALAKKYNKPLHVDASMGGFIAPFYRDSNIACPKFDFLLEGNI
jgi:sphinganine-1-phosphate aldolase